MKRMAKIELKYVKAYKDRHGTLRHYFRRKGFPTVVLPGPAGSAEFLAAYAEAEAQAPRPQAVGSKVQPRSINALIIQYYQSTEFRDLKEITQRGYRNMLDRFRDKHGNKSAISVQTHHFEAIFHGMADTPGAAVNLRKRLRRVFRLAVRLGWRKDNPVVETELRRKKTKGFIPWSEEDIAKYLEHWAPGTRERLALLLFLCAGQRRSDTVTMGRQHVKDGKISACQLKTETRVLIPMHPLLRAELELHPSTDLTFLLTQYGLPFSAAGFTGWFVERAKMAGVVDRTPHGLRKAAGRRLAEAGCTVHQIMAVLGHVSLGEAEKYTRDADRAQLADDAFEKLLEAETRTSSV
ncbi:tyrosine-type recombinase/integrase [Caulobacter mirabilis]|uniref:Tyr recombinase domain-containing protein n=1 Tax=Caulobacter mirabilis TaxID=69666 RepID=A0A2D2AZZ3_9CAUL|nr:tyrosine-type recombinase/integrase [Caulobacter mirabilis]ATQ43588.1 hypothetical protein CSW64_14860 [Caulobacter mirabilis]